MLVGNAASDHMNENNQGGSEHNFQGGNAMANHQQLRKNRLEALSPLDTCGSFKKNDNLTQLFK